uniref:Uncharacterized protein n=1 Tax=Cucumis sativus TaxID=3659 RepID=A0A0A0L0A7_CUCSA
MKVIRGLNKSTGVVLEYLQEAKEHGHRKGKDILASIPGYWEVICSIFEGEDEHMFISAQLLPAIRQLNDIPSELEKLDKLFEL